MTYRIYNDKSQPQAEDKPGTDLVSQAAHEDLGPLLTPARLIPACDIIRDRSLIPDVAGIYGWWFDTPLPGVPLEGTLALGDHRLLYVGIAPRKPSAAGSYWIVGSGRLESHTRSPGSDFSKSRQRIEKPTASNAGRIPCPSRARQRMWTLTRQFMPSRAPECWPSRAVRPRCRPGCPSLKPTNACPNSWVSVGAGQAKPRYSSSVRLVLGPKFLASAMPM